MIDKVIHQIWLQGWDALPDDIKEYTDSCVRINNGFKHVKWDESSIQALLKKHGDADLTCVYDSLDSYASKSDLARYLILWHFGGFYFDTDFIFYKPVDVFTGADFVRRKSHHHFDKFKFKYGRIANSVIGARPNHPVFEITLDNLKKRAMDQTSSMLGIFCETTYKTGCNLFYDSIMQYHDAHPQDANYLVIANEQLFPSSVNDDDKSNLKRYKNVAFMTHMHNLSWSPVSRFYVKARKYRYVFAAAAIALIVAAILIYKNKRRI